MRLDLFLDRCGDTLDGFVFHLGVASVVTLVFVWIEDQCGEHYIRGLLNDER